MHTGVPRPSLSGVKSELSSLGPAFDNTYASELEGFYVAWQGDLAPSPRIVQLNSALAQELGIDVAGLSAERAAAWLSGSEAPPGAAPLAQAYAGHQFGGFVPQLGDGRALLLGEIIDRQGRRWDLQLKGSGPTPFARGGDGKAVLGPVLREYLIGEAMHALGVPTTRALAAVTTGERVMRTGAKPGAVLARVAASHLRVGTFQYFASRQQADRVRQLADYAIARHFPELADRDDRYLGLLRAVMDRHAGLVAKWMGVGFVHGVMNTDNTSISGETLDYGPCAFIDSYSAGAVFSSIDHHGRYAYGRQPLIAQWNLARFAETLLQLIDPTDVGGAIEQATAEVDRFPGLYRAAWLEVMRGKLGLQHAEDSDAALIDDLLAGMEAEEADFTQRFRVLADILRGSVMPATNAWTERWLARVDRECGDRSGVADRMDGTNPVYIPRNHKVEEALEAAERNADYAPFQRLLAVLEQPFERRAGLEEYEGPAADDFGRYVTYCGT